MWEWELKPTQPISVRWEQVLIPVVLSWFQTDNILSVGFKRVILRHPATQVNDNLLEEPTDMNILLTKKSPITKNLC